MNTTMESARVRKANALNEVFMVETDKRLVLNEQKVYLAVMSQIQPDDLDFQTYSLTVPDLVGLTGISQKHLYSEIMGICKNLVSSVITIKEPSNPEGFLVTTWFAHARYSPIRGHVEFSFSPVLKPYLINLKQQFTSYHLKQVINLQSVHSLRLYELLRQYLPLKMVKGGNKESRRYMKVSELKGFLGLGDGKYKNFTDFRRRILDVGKKELEEKTDIKFDYTTERKGRFIDRIVFTIKDNTPAPENQPDDCVEEINEGDPVVTDINPDMLALFRIVLPEVDELTATVLMSAVDEQLLKESLIEYYRALKKGTVINNSLAYLNKIIDARRKGQAEEERRIKEEEGLPDEDRPSRPTMEEFMDRSWADKYDFGFGQYDTKPEKE